MHFFCRLSTVLLELFLIFRFKNEYIDLPDTSYINIFKYEWPHIKSEPTGVVPLLDYAKYALMYVGIRPIDLYNWSLYW